MDRFYLAVTVFALLLLLGVAGLDVTRTADIMPPGRSVPQDCSSKRGSPDYRSTSHEQSSGDEYPRPKNNNQGQLGQLE
jgi:hypothetical protein